MKYFYFSLIFLFLVSCNSTVEPETIKEEIKNSNKFTDENIQTIYNLLDHHQADSLLIYLTHENPVYRAEAADAFATIQDSTYLNELYPLLSDADPLVQQKAAWAIGQTNNHGSVIPLINSLSSISTLAQTEVLEAIGKCAKETDLSYFEDFEVSSANSLGYSKALYHYVYRNSMAPSLFEKALNLFPTMENTNAKMLLAGAIAREKSSGLLTFEDEIFTHINNEKDTEILLPLYSILGKIQSEANTIFLEEKIQNFNKNIPDYRIIVATLSAYSKQKKTSWKVFKTWLSHANENIGLAASKCLTNSDYYPKFHPETNVVKDPYSSRVDANILSYSLKKTKNKRWLQNIQFKYRNAPNYLDKSFYLRALRINKHQAKWIEDKMINEGHPIIKTAAAESLVEMRENDRIPKNMDFLKTIQAGFKTNDVGVLATFAIHLTNEDMGYQNQIKKIQFLDDALLQLTLPRDIETYNEILKAKSVFTGEKYTPKVIEYNNPIDWELIKNIPNNQMATVLTNKGKIEIVLDVENAPGSVSNFIKLANDGFFDNKVFHRVVPNFVVQTGCPRGDGYGSINHTIRSEFSLHNYTTGAVGMASAGKDTESCQWFITHTPTPFLEGRYTIFGYVNEPDLLTLHQLKMGDQILSVTIK